MAISLTRQQLAQVFKDPRTLLEFEQLIAMTNAVGPDLANVNFVVTSPDPAAAPNGHALLPGAGINITVGSGSVTISLAGTLTTSFSAGSTGLTPNTPTSGAVVLAGTLNTTHGGTDQSSYTTGDLLYASSATTLGKRTIGSTGQVLTVVGGIPAWATPAFAPQAPQATILTSGTGTYTPPAGALYLRVEMVGGAGGGGGGGSTGVLGALGSAGSATTFGPMTANGGLGGHQGGSGSARAGGTATLGAGPVGIALQGASGQYAPAGNADFSAGGVGASSPFGGAGGGGTNAVGQAAIANTGSGGGGGGTNSAASINQGGGGGTAGGYIDAMITTLAASYSYGVGTGGAGGAGGAGIGFTGGTGGSGLIKVTAYFQ